MGLGYRFNSSNQALTSLNFIVDYGYTQLLKAGTWDITTAISHLRGQWGLHGSGTIWQQKDKAHKLGNLGVDPLREWSLARYALHHRLAMHAGVIRVSERFVPTAKINYQLPTQNHGGWGIHGRFDYLKKIPRFFKTVLTWVPFIDGLPNQPKPIMAYDLI